VKIAFDENVPMAMVKVFETFAKERQFKKLTGTFVIKSAKDYTPFKSDPDYQPSNDVPWIKRFYADGGRIIISGNTEMKSVPHERLALIECGMIVFFFEGRWSKWRFFEKCAHLMHWWPVVAAKAHRAKKGTFWHIPLNWTAQEKGKLRAVSNRDPLELKLERRAAQDAKKRGLRRPARSRKADPDGDIPVDLFAYASRANNAKK
jgi:hypothetical protein